MEAINLIWYLGGIITAALLVGFAGVFAYKNGLRDGRNERAGKVGFNESIPGMVNGALEAIRARHSGSSIVEVDPIANQTAEEQATANEVLDEVLDIENE